MAWWRQQTETFSHYWPFVRGFHRSPVNSPHNGQWRGALMFPLILAWINGWVNNRDAGDSRRHHNAYYDVTVGVLRWEGKNSLWKQLLDLDRDERALIQVMPLQWRHYERDGVSNPQPHDCLLNCLFRRRSKKTSKFRVTRLCEGNSPVTGEFPAQRASNAENVSTWWRHRVRAQIK